MELETVVEGSATVKWVCRIVFLTLVVLAVVSCSGEPREALCTGALEFDLWAADLDGNLVQLTDFDGGEAQADWSPDGSKIAFVASREGNCDIFVMDADGSNLVNLTDSSVDETRPSWSPDGSMMAFIGDGQIQVIDVASGESRRLTDSELSHGFEDWSPDGGSIVFDGGQEPPGPGTVRELYVASLATGEETRLVDSPTQLTAPKWSPDGTRMVYFDHGTDPLTIWIVNSDGSGATRVTKGGHATWSPDGSRIVFDREVGPGDVDLFELNLEEGHEQVLVDGTDYDTLPAWSPDGTEVVFSSGTISASSQ